MKRMIFGLGLLFCGNLGIIGVFIVTNLHNNDLFNDAIILNENIVLFLYFLFSLILTVYGLIILIKENKKI